jgi:hypothetical protein
MSLYSEAAFKGAIARGGLGFGDAGFRNSALEAWAYNRDQELIAAARAEAAAVAGAPVVAEVVEADFASVETDVAEMPAPFEFPVAQIG